jgi:CheY-like chemotaxis protein
MLDNILLIDDDEATNYIHTRIISKWGKCKNTLALESAEEALQYLGTLDKDSKPNPDMILLDINMPRMNGWEFLEEYNKLGIQDNKDIKVVMITTSHNPEDIKKSKATKGIADFRHKPLSHAILEEITLDLH